MPSQIRALPKSGVALSRLGCDAEAKPKAELRLQSRNILQIVPRRTSGPDGIGDYAVRVADGLARHHGIGSVFVCGTPPGEYPPAEDDWPKINVAARTAQALIDALNVFEKQHAFDATILHVGGYGYAKRGVPLWLLDGMRQWRRRSPDARLVGIFHELHASGKPWNSSFWLGPLQKHVARQLWNLADCGLTTNKSRPYVC